VKSLVNSLGEFISLPLTISVQRLLKLDLDVEFLDKVFPNFKELRKRDLTGLNDLFEAFYSRPDPPDTASIESLDTKFQSALELCSITKASRHPQLRNEKQRFIEIHAKLDDANLRGISCQTPGNYLQLQLSRAGLLQFASSEYNDYTIRIVCGSTSHGGVRDPLVGAPWAHKVPCHDHFTEVYREILEAGNIQKKKEGPTPSGYVEIGPLRTEDWRAIQDPKRCYHAVREVYIRMNTTEHNGSSSRATDDYQLLQSSSSQPETWRSRAPDNGPNKSQQHWFNNTVPYNTNRTTRANAPSWRRVD